MPSIFGKSHLYRYDIQGGAKSHYLVFVHLPCLQTHLKHLYQLSLLPFNDYEQQTIECLMNHNSLTRDCINYLLQRLHIRDGAISNCFALSYYNKSNNQSYWLDPNISMRQQVPKSELKPNLTFTMLLYPPVPYAITDEKARLILYQQIFCNFISSMYTISGSLVETLSAYFLRACFDNKFNADKNHDVLQLIIAAVGISEEKSDIVKDRIFELYRNLNGIDIRSAQNQFVHQISQLNTYGMIHLEIKNALNETICLGLSHTGIHCRSLLRNEFKLEACWHNITSIVSNKQRQITVTIKNDNINTHMQIYYTDSTNYNRYCLRLLHVFLNHFSKYVPSEIENIPKLETFPIKKPCLVHGASVPDLRSDGESSSNDRSPPSASSSARSSNHSSNLWTGSLPNLTVQLSTRQQTNEIFKKKNDPYATFSDNLNHIDEQETISPVEEKEVTLRHSLPVPYKSQSPMYKKFSHRSLLMSTARIGLSCSLATFDKISVSPSMVNASKIPSSINLSPCFSCECLDRGDKDSILQSSSNLSTLTTNNRLLLNSRTYLSSTSVPLEIDTISVDDDDDAPTDIWLADFESKLSNNIVYDEFDSIPVSRINGSIQDGRLSDNTHRNRYADVIPYDDTRVRLIPTKDNLHGYINASHVKIRVENTIYSYIAAESPLPLTVHDFWRMISGSNIHVIVMLIGNDPQLCANYFPKHKNEKCRTDEFEIELISEQNRQDFHIRYLRMKVLNGQRTRTIVHLQYVAWDEAQLPLDATSFIDFINVANSFRRHYGETNPCLVHCTAGIGRTGIFILTHVMIQCITFNKKVSVASVLKVMREHRMSLVDRTYSYVFVYRCLIDYLKSSRLI
ncbi:unnamed protein product [Rotaria socialis]|uniref:Uncharacterized protein n=2 Tax=Rotaria socialis TaxID=392032 RepID=A0A817T361_9BILA|nr:unnamed protein product [Rotaria socialis]CAF3192531.1 unnamed protein product [Rotaria socialis]CAF3309142.1 unnamed protein product [Rotaria socialis]CAF3577845.1 unnamed protein product [Rotaria socialis]CAF4200446.1 unnamed protein product [Rotaria socialis]